jgi:hypothetical protein
MAKKKYRPINRSTHTQNVQPSASPGMISESKKVNLKSYNAEEYIRRDITGTLISAAIVIVVGVILYYILK